MSCLFDTLSNFVDLNSNELRQNICNYLSENPRILEDTSAKEFIMWNGEGHSSLETYINNMRGSSTWGGAIEIKAFCNMYNMDVNVHDTRGGKHIINFIDEGRNRPLIDINWNGGHYWT